MKHRYTRCHQRLMAVLRAARQEAGLTQRALSAKLKRTKNFVYYIESGLRSLTVCELFDYARACDADPYELLGQIDPAKQRLT